MLTTKPEGFFDAYLNSRYDYAEREMYRAKAQVLSAARVTSHIHAVFSWIPVAYVPDPYIGSDYLSFNIYPSDGEDSDWYDRIMRIADMLDDIGVAPVYSASSGKMALEWTYDNMTIVLDVWRPSPTCKAVTKTVKTTVVEWVCEG